MATNTLPKIETVIATLKELDVPASGIKAALKKKGYKEEDIIKLVKTRTTEGLSFPEVIASLEAKPVTEKAFAEFILDKATKNEARWFNDRNRIRKVTNAIHVKGGATFKEVEASKELLKKLKDKSATKAAK
jgi:hypothetical protein